MNDDELDKLFDIDKKTTDDKSSDEKPSDDNAGKASPETRPAEPAKHAGVLGSGFDFRAYAEKEYLPNFPFSFKETMKLFLMLSVLILVVFVAFHPFFRVGEITVVGNSAAKEEEIIAALGIEPGSHIFSTFFVSDSALKAQKPYISDVRVTRYLPSSVTIEVEERLKLAYIRTPDGYIAIDADGTVLEFSTFDAGDVRPVLCGLDIGNAVLGERIDVIDSSKFRQMIVVLSTALTEGENQRTDYSLFENIREIRIVPSGVIFIQVYLPSGASLQVKLSNMSTIGDKIHWLAYAIENEAFEGLPDGVLDMTDDDPIYREYGYEIPEIN